MLSETNIFSYFADLEDPRTGNNIAHPLENVITIAILAVICGADGWVDVERYPVGEEESGHAVSRPGATVRWL